MITSIELENFRCFRHLSLKNLGRVNIIVGPNSSGKTALMEAIFLAASSNPELAIRLKGFRGLATPNLTYSKAYYESLWKDLFYEFNQDSVIRVNLQGSHSFCRDLTIYYKKDGGLLLDVSSHDSLTDNLSPMAPIIFEWYLAEGKSFEAKPILKPGGWSVEYNSGFDQIPTAFYTSAYVSSPEENAAYFSSLSVQNKESLIVEAIKSEFPFIESLSLEVFNSSPCIFAAQTGIQGKIPLNLISSGVSKLISILLGIANQRGGVVCIDELENGFYYDRLPSIWKLILSFSKQFDVQIFCSTHSWECLQALKSTVSENQSEFRLIQPYRKGGNQFRVQTGEILLDSLDQRIDVR